jgi:hypothetical protein
MANIKSQLKQKRQRSYLNRDFDSFRASLLEYARTYYPDRIADFSEASVGGLFLDMAAYVGDVMSFYIDHQFGELDVNTAIERANIIRQIKAAGVKVAGASPATANVDMYFEVQSRSSGGSSYTPNSTQLPVVLKGTQVTSSTGIVFELLDDVNFAETDSSGDLIAQYKISAIDTSGNPTRFLLKRTAQFTSSKTVSETFTISDTFIPFRTIGLSQPDVTEIISVKDSDGNEYYEVEYLVQDVVFKRANNISADSDQVPESIELTPAPYRFTAGTDIDTGLTTMRFGSGNADTLDNDIIPDPSEVSLPLYGSRKTFSRFTLDPGRLLGSRTLGISPRATTISALYRSGGGISHNVDAGSIRNTKTLITQFSESVSPALVASIRSTFDVNNPSQAAGGESALTVDELKELVPAYRNAQSRIVTKDDLIARIYTMPSNFGRVYRVGVRSNENNPLATVVAIISRDSNGRLTQSPDTLKKNLATFINQYRLISDGVDIVDARVINFYLRYSISVDITSNKSMVTQEVSNRIKDYFSIKNFQIDQPIIVSEITSLILGTQGIISLADLQILNRSGVVDGRGYSDVQFDFISNTAKGVVFGQPGSIFELRYPTSDIIGVVI